MHHSAAPDELLSMAIDYAMYVDLRTATTSSREWLTPFEMIKGEKPRIDRLHRFYTQAFVAVPKSKRKKLAQKGLTNTRAEPGRFLGFHDPFSNTYRVLLTGNRLVHSIDVTFDDSNFIHTPVASQAVQGGILLPPFLEDQAPELSQALESETPQHNPLFAGQPYVQISPCPIIPDSPEFFDPDDTDWKLDGSPQARPRPNYAGQMLVSSNSAPAASVFFSTIDDAIAELDTTKSRLLVEEALATLTQANSVDYGAIQSACLALAQASMKDMHWAKALKGPDRSKVIAALDKEIASLEDCILREITPDHPDWNECVANAVPGRYLLDYRRSGEYKARGVKQGFREDKTVADGPGFIYYSHVARLTTVRMALFRSARGERQLGIKDVRTAFLQAKKFPTTLRKWISFRNPVTGKVHYYRQLGPIYGEASAPVRWEDTLAPTLEKHGFDRAQNEPSVFRHPIRDLLVLLYVDDTLIDGDDASIQYFDETLDQEFDCKELHPLKQNLRLDFLGMEISRDTEHLYLSMESYTRLSCELFDLENSSTISTPIDRPIDPDSPPLTAESKKLFMTANGHLGWLVNTVRPDCAFAFSHISQFLASPNESALEALKRVFRYLKHTSRLCLASKLHSNKPGGGWEFYTDSDHASNVHNGRKTQIGFLATENGAPVEWSSKATSVAFANTKIGEAHADTSSSAAEVYAAGNAAQDIQYLSYLADESGIDFPEPAVLQMDNTAAEAFSKNSCFKSKLKHIDVRQEWVKTLRDKSLLTPTHVKSADNLADLFTKILPPATFIRLRDHIMKTLPAHIQ
jgi:hypothetical protein